MDEFKKLYTVEDIAKMTSLTSRTIRNYLKDGSLQGKKIGGQWRFTMEDIGRLFNNGNLSKDMSDNKKQELFDFIEGVNTDIHGKIQICTIIDYYCSDQEEAKQISDRLITVINNQENKFSQAKFHYQFIEKECKARFILYGVPEYMMKTLEMLS